MKNFSKHSNHVDFLNLIFSIYKLFQDYFRDVQRIRRITRSFYYQFENHEFYRLLSIRARMSFHRFIDKEEVIHTFNPEKEEWKWAIHLKPTKVRKYGRFWKPEIKKEIKRDL